MSTYELELHETGDPTVTHVRLSGELDLTNVHELESKLEEIADSDTTLVLDLNRVVFIDSAALHVLFRIGRSRGRERYAVVLEPSAVIARALAIVGIEKIAKVVASPQDLSSALATD